MSARHQPWTEDRLALLRRHIGTRLHNGRLAELMRELNAMPGPPIRRANAVAVKLHYLRTAAGVRIQ